MPMDLSEQYDKIYRYCYFKLGHRETAEDITQEAFLRYFDSIHSVRYEEQGKALRYLYTIARNLCIDEFRKRPLEQLPETQGDVDGADMEDRLLTSLSVKKALHRLDREGQELLLLRYVNEVPVSVICNVMGISRFAVYRKTNGALKQLKEQLGKEGLGGKKNEGSVKGSI